MIITLTMAVASSVVAGCGGDSNDTDTAGVTPRPEASGEVVTIEQFTFSPARIEVKAGTTVRWENRDPFLHTVTSGDTSGAENVPDRRFDEDLPEKGSRATVTFEEPGTFTYYCRQHNAMDGTVVVT